MTLTSGEFWQSKKGAWPFVDLNYVITAHEAGQQPKNLYIATPATYDEILGAVILR